MTDRQLFKYRAEWARAWKILRHRVTTDNETTRKRWHLLIGAVVLRGPNAGEPKSSTRLTNREFDAFLKRCASVHTPEGLERQLELDAMPERRALVACEPLLDEIAMPTESRPAYIAGIYANVQRKRAAAGERVFELHEMPDADLQIVLAALTHTVEHKLGIEHNHPTTGKGWRSKYAHRVGRRSGRTGDEADEIADLPIEQPPFGVRQEQPDPAYVPPADQPF